MRTRFALFILVAVLGRLGAQSLPDVPANLTPPAGSTLLLAVSAKGDQIYACEADSANPSKMGWVLRAPEANLFDVGGKPAGKHFKGPTWEVTDGSRVTGKVLANATPDPDSIPWLLLTAVTHSDDGLMSKVTSIQRLHTKGGKAPTAVCDASIKDQVKRVDYTADYYFYGASK